MNEITDSQAHILRVIRQWIADHGEGPTIREIGQQVGLSGPSSVEYPLRQLEQIGAISRSGRSWALSVSADVRALADN
ncbi:LexA family protein [Streptomyces sp. NPDC002889]|uniref:LexA family protein n=1 Tax=Streptomyces sp. NPDC002889 TaxID=3364669 RepID=UPI0036B651EB